MLLCLDRSQYIRIIRVPPFESNRFGSLVQNIEISAIREKPVSPLTGNLANDSQSPQMSHYACHRGECGPSLLCRGSD
jgi:hypothetical protein